MSDAEISLVVRRTIRASKQRIFEAWTDADQLEAWWGPAGVRCSGAEVDLRVGGRYRIENALPDGRVAVIVGEFERITPPDELVYTWRLGDSERLERVTVRFDERAPARTEVTIVHQRITDQPTRDEHEQGWLGCLDGLEQYVASQP